MRITSILIALFAWSFNAYAQSAQIQFLHNSADRTISVVDVWLSAPGGIPYRIANDLSFRTATPFIGVPTNPTYTIRIAPSTSSSADESYPGATFSLPELSENQKIIVAICGVNDSTLKANPNSVSTKLGLSIFPIAKTLSNGNGAVDIVALNGVTDSDITSINIRDQSSQTGVPFFRDLRFKSFSNDYLATFNGEFIFDVVQPPNATSLGSYRVQLNQYDGQAIVMFTSGFVKPEDNKRGAKYGLFTLSPDGRVRELLNTNAPPIAYLMLVHNSPDAAAEIVDVYLGSSRVADNLAYRYATTWLEVPTKVFLNGSINLQTSTDSSDGIVLPFSLDTLTTQSYNIVFVDGVIDSSGLTNKSGKSMKLQTTLLKNVPANADASNTSIVAYNGVFTEENLALRLYPQVLVGQQINYKQSVQITNDKITSDSIRLFTSAGSIGDYLIGNKLTPLGSYLYVASGITASSNPRTKVGIYVVPLASEALSSLTNKESVRLERLNFVSGNGAERAAIQYFQASPSQRLIDVYANDIQVSNDLPFRSATAAVSYSAGSEVVYSLNDSSSVSAFSNRLATNVIDNRPNVNTLVVYSGVKDSTSLPNFTGKSIAQRTITVDGKFMAKDSGTIEIAAFNCARNINYIKMSITGVTQSIASLGYNELSDYLVVRNDAPATITIQGYRTRQDADPTLVSVIPINYVVTGDKTTGVVLITDSINGLSSDVRLIMSAGDVLLPTTTTSVDKLDVSQTTEVTRIVPSPSYGSLVTVYSETISQSATVRCYSTIGNSINIQSSLEITDGKATFSTDHIPSGHYTIVITNHSETKSVPMMIVR